MVIWPAIRKHWKGPGTWRSVNNSWAASPILRSGSHRQDEKHSAVTWMRLKRSCCARKTINDFFLTKHFEFQSTLIIGKNEKILIPIVVLTGGCLYTLLFWDQEAGINLLLFFLLLYCLLWW